MFTKFARLLTAFCLAIFCFSSNLQAGSLDLSTSSDPLELIKGDDVVKLEKLAKQLHLSQINAYRGKDSLQGRTTVTVPGDIWMSAEFDSTGKIVRYKTRYLNNTYTYDQNGNLTTIESGETKTLIFYDDKGRLIAAAAHPLIGQNTRDLFFYNSSGKLWIRKTYYTEEKNLKGVAPKDSNRIEIKTYFYREDDGRISRIDVSNPSGFASDTRTIAYTYQDSLVSIDDPSEDEVIEKFDKNNNMTYRYVGGDSGGDETFVFDDKGNETSCSGSFMRDYFSETLVNTYYDNGLLKERHVTQDYDSNSFPTYTFYSYTFYK